MVVKMGKVIYVNFSGKYRGKVIETTGYEVVEDKITTNDMKDTKKYLEHLEHASEWDDNDSA
jgi:hypothetical protein